MIRSATLADARWVSDLERRCFGPDAWSYAQVVEELTGAGRRAWVAEGTAYVVVRATDDPLDPVDLQRIAVAPAERRRGLARALLGVARPARARLLLEVSEANAGGRAFYERAGCVQIARRRRYYADGTDALVLALEPDRGRPDQDG